jgi:hypothetical protein
MNKQTLQKGGLMKKLALCLILLFVSMPLLAGATGIGIGIHGGIEMMVVDTTTETYPAIGGIVDFSLPGIPIGLRGGCEYAWKSYDDYKVTDIIILLAGQYNVVLPGAPMSFYLGAGGQLCMASTDIPDSEGSTDFGFLAYAGANYSMGMMGIFAEVGYGMIFSDPESATNIPIRGGIKFNL